MQPTFIMNRKPLPEAYAMQPLIEHPSRALPPGKQWIPHCGKKQRARYLKQQRNAELKRLRKLHGSSVITGVDADGALLLDFPAPVRGQ